MSAGSTDRGAAAATPRSASSGWLPERLARWDWGLLAAYGMLVVGFTYISLPETGASVWWPMPVLAVGGIATLLVRQRRPVVALGASLVLTVLSFAFGSTVELFVVLVLLFEVGAERSAKAAWTSFAAAGSAVVLALAPVMANRLVNGPSVWGLGTRHRPGPSTLDALTDWGNVILVVLPLVLIATLVGVNVGHRRRYVAALVERAEQLRRERDQQASIIRADERELIAREMHDVIAHSIAVMIALADGAHASADRRPAASKDAIARVADTGRRTLGEVRRLLGVVRVGDLGPPGPPGAPGVEELPALVEEFRAASLPVRLELHGAQEDPVVGFTVYRIVQESLTNVLRHAHGVRDVLVDVALSRDGSAVVVEDVSDVAEATADTGRGLLGIRERAAFYHGEVEAGPRAGGGWRVAVQLPTAAP